MAGQLYKEAQGSSVQLSRELIRWTSVAFQLQKGAEAFLVTLSNKLIKSL